MLKQDLVDGVLIPSAQPAALQVFFSPEAVAVLPPPSSAGVERLANLWSYQSSELLTLADVTAHATDLLGEAGICLLRQLELKTRNSGASPVFTHGCAITCFKNVQSSC